jgi:hypothetical protein
MISEKKLKELIISRLTELEEEIKRNNSLILLGRYEAYQDVSNWLDMSFEETHHLCVF